MKAHERLTQAQDEVFYAERSGDEKRIREALDELYGIEIALDDEREDRHYD